jgi:hypothetical protein
MGQFDYSKKRTHRNHHRGGRHREERPREERPREEQPAEDVNEASAAIEPDGTGNEAIAFKSLVDSKKKVTVVLTTGERLRGRVRYYDRDCFSLGPLGGGPNLFLRKSSVLYVLEE